MGGKPEVEALEGCHAEEEGMPAQLTAEEYGYDGAWWRPLLLPPMGIITACLLAEFAPPRLSVVSIE